MHNIVERNGSSFMVMGLLMLTGLALPPIARAQTPVVAQEKFGGIDQSLMQKADTLLVNPATDETATAKRSAEIEGQLNPVGSNSAERGSGSGRRANAAVTRLNELRPWISPILMQQGVPQELAAVIVVESGGDAAALSAKGARGLWQLMPDTARRYGLIVDGIRDERLDIGKSTRAAARYLSDLYAQFGSWPLALAAYNTGEQTLQHAMDRARSSDFSVLSSSGLLPLETRKYVPAVLAAMHSNSGQLNLGQVRRVPASSIVFALNVN